MKTNTKDIWYPPQPKVVQATGIKIARYASAIGAIFAAAYYFLPDTAVTPSAPAHSTASEPALSAAEPNQLQAMQASSPAASNGVEGKAEVPINVIPTKKPSVEVTRDLAGSKPKLTLGNPQTEAGVVRFNRCIPACETRDPMVASAGRQFPTRPAANNGTVDDIVEPSPLQPVSYLMGKAVALPSIVVSRGRDVLHRVLGVD